MAHYDLCLLQTSIEIEVHLSYDADSRAVARPSNEGRDWAVALTPYDGEGPTLSEASLEALAVLYTILSEVSLLPEAELYSRIEAAFARGLLQKVPVGRLYDELRDGFVPEFPTPTSDEVELVTGEWRGERAEHPSLSWRGSIGPGYSPQRSEEQIERRYVETGRRLPLTLSRLRESITFRAVVDALRARGFKDWHILLGVFNVAWNFRLAALGLDRGWDDPTQELVVKQLISEPETPDLPEPPIDLFTEERLAESLPMSMPETLRAWDLELHQRTPDLPAIERFLAVRYRYWDDDVDHEEIF